ncbi:alpha/beta hydrolase [Lederbergia sp. NSJ-179]|uniref:alpha/beta hydrolase n=1 Tax=Lederbergia sp. NSJ-179 TaxID=2931402 RepID=UPI001FD355C9|nr:alpha/beta hydrolase [Lederbergia sp. NSJ-179]MCJ7842669.1 alpha/beta hydrolase [Lederbergia sp. NSJ-179]
MRKFETEQQAVGVIVIIHGALEHHGRYGWLIEMWRAHGFHVITGDLPGQGLTTRAHRGHIDSFDQYVNETLDWVQTAKAYSLPVFVLGHSMGGLTAIRLLQTREIEVDGVILSSPCLGLAEYPPIPLNAITIGLNWIAPEWKVNPGLDVEFTTRDEDTKERTLNDSLTITKVSIRWYRELLKAMKRAFMQLSNFPDIPLLVLQGGDDKIVDKLEVAKWFNQVKSSEKIYKEWVGCYHEIFNEPEKEQIFMYTKNFVDMRLRFLEGR